MSWSKYPVTWTQIKWTIFNVNQRHLYDSNSKLNSRQELPQIQVKNLTFWCEQVRPRCWYQLQPSLYINRGDTDKTTSNKDSENTDHFIFILTKSQLEPSSVHPITKHGEIAEENVKEQSKPAQ